MRAAFTEVFGEDIETVLASTASVLPCTVPLCNAVATTTDDPWDIEAPGSCDDPRAVGGRRSAEPIVTAEGVFSLPLTGSYPVEFDGIDTDDQVALQRCDDACTAASDEIRVFPGSTGPLELEAGQWRVTISNRSGTPASRFALRSPGP